MKEFKLKVVPSEIYDPIKIFNSQRWRLLHESCALWHLLTLIFARITSTNCTFYFLYFKKLINLINLNCHYIARCACFFYVFSIVLMQYYSSISESSRVISERRAYFFISSFGACLSWITVSHDRMNHCQSRLLSFRYTPLIFVTF